MTKLDAMNCLLVAAACTLLAACAAPGPRSAGVPKAPAPAQVFEAKEACPGHPLSPDHEIAICTRAIESRALPPGDLAVAYYYRATAWADKKMPDKAIADYTRAVGADPDLGVAYYNRAIAHGQRGHYDAAIADYTESIRVDPEFSAAFNNRAMAFAAQGNAERAIPDFNEAIRLNPDLARAWFGRALAYFNVGHFDVASNDLAEAARLGMKSPYLAMWRRLAEGRSGEQAAVEHLQAATESVDPGKWPAPLIQMLAGQIDAPALYKAAESPNAATRAGQLCEAHFYFAEYLLVGHEQAQATALLTSAERECPHDYTEYQAIVAELSRLRH
jgi:lipoprotein NlpI